MNTAADKATILVVDDDEDLRQAIAFDLTRRGYAVLTAADGLEALDVIRSRPIELVLSDIRMPGMDGVELLRQVKAMNHELPVVIFITGFADLSLEQAYDLGADAVLPKPFDRAEFFRIIERSLLPKSQRWTRPERATAQAAIELSLPGIRQAVLGHLVNLGRGGMFVALDHGLPIPDSAVSFKLLFDGEEALEGRGLVRWCRSRAQGPERPAGCGIEFEFLSPPGVEKVLEWAKECEMKAFIPAA